MVWDGEREECAVARVSTGLDSLARVAVGDETLDVLIYGGPVVLAREAFEGLVALWHGEAEAGRDSLSHPR